MLTKNTRCFRIRNLYFKYKWKSLAFYRYWTGVSTMISSDWLKQIRVVVGREAISKDTIGLKRSTCITQNIIREYWRNGNVEKIHCQKDGSGGRLIYIVSFQFKYYTFSTWNSKEIDSKKSWSLKHWDFNNSHWDMTSS